MRCSRPSGTLSTRGAAPSPPQRQPHRAALGLTGGAEILHRQPQLHAAADNAIARRLDDADAPVDLARAAGQQQMQRRLEAGLRRDVMRLAIGQRDHPRQPRARDVGQGPVDGGEQPRALAPALRQVDHPQLQVGEAGGGFLDRGAGGVQLRAARADPRRIAAVLHQQGDVGAGLPRLLDQARIGQRQQQHGKGQRPPPGAARPPPQRRQQRQHRQQGQRRQQPERQDGGEIDARDGLAHHPTPAEARPGE
ncbi:hypothetical protein [Teichococcus cervicalis]